MNRLGGLPVGLWERLPRHIDGERMLWEGPSAVVAAAMVGSDVLPVDTAGKGRGFCVLTDRRLVVGHLTKLSKRPEVWDEFELDALEVNMHDPRGVAFIVTRIGPIDLVLVSPAEDVDGLRSAAEAVGQDSEQ